MIEDIGLASLDLLELRFELEERWKTRITDEEAIRLKTVRDVVDLIAQRVEAASGRHFWVPSYKCSNAIL